MREDFNKIYITEDNFINKMETEVEPWIEKNALSGKFETFDGKQIQYYAMINPQERASIVMVHGFCEFYPKFYEHTYYFYNMGYSVFFIEQRGHGFSDRDVPQFDHVSVNNYDEYVEDLKVFMDTIVSNNSKTGNYIGYAHSMGGCILSLFLEKYPDYFKRAVLSSPMHRMNFRGTPTWQVNLLVVVSKILGWNNKLVPGQKEFDGINVWEKSSSMSKARYDYQFNKRLSVPEYTTYGGTYTWVRASVAATAKCRKQAGRITVPVLLLSAGRDTMVDNSGHDDFVAKKPDTKLVILPESKHEIFNATEDIARKYWSVVFDFIEET